jgi:quinol monooxygenase YgiN
VQQAASGGTPKAVVSFFTNDRATLSHCMRERTETVIAAYRPKPGKDQALRKLIREHRKTLSAAHLITARPSLVLRARSDGTLLEIFEWTSAKAADEAHQHPAIRAMWNKLSKVADFVPLSAVQEASKAFSHFEALTSSAPRVRALAAKRPATKRPTR